MYHILYHTHTPHSQVRGGGRLVVFKDIQAFIADCSCQLDEVLLLKLIQFFEAGDSFTAYHVYHTYTTHIPHTYQGIQVTVSSFRKINDSSKLFMAILQSQPSKP